MAHNKYAPPAKTHETKQSRKDRKEQKKEWADKHAEMQAQQQQVVPQEEIVPTAEDKDQLKRLGTIAGVVIVGLLFFMYYMFAWS